MTEDRLKPYAVRLLIRGRQLGDDRTYLHWYRNDEEAIQDRHSYFSRIYGNRCSVTVAVDYIERWKIRTPILIITIEGRSKSEQ